MASSKTLAARFPDAVCRRCQKGECRLLVDGFYPGPTVLDCDRYRDASGHQGPICDYLILFEAQQPAMAVSVEMKSRSFHTREALEQLRAGAQVADALMSDHERVRFFPVLLSRALHASELKVLRTMKVRFRGTDLRVIQRRCGARLVDIVG